MTTFCPFEPCLEPSEVDTMRTLAFVAVIGAALATLPAQRTWIVDGSNGPGTHFPDIPPAIAAAAPGDAILIRKGYYSGATISKALAVVGLGGVRIGLAGVSSLIVTSLPAGHHVVIASVELFSTASVTQNLGTVHLETIKTLTPSFALRIAASELVTMSRCSVTGVDVVDSTLSVRESSLSGATHFTGMNPATVTEAVRLGRAVLHASDTTILGIDAMFGPLTRPASNGIIATDSRIELTGRTVVRGGLPDYRNYYSGRAGIWGTSSTAEVDPRARVLGYPPVTAGVVARSATIPALDGSATAESRVNVRLRTPGGRGAVVLAGLPAAPVATPFGQIALDPATARVVAVSATSGDLDLTWSAPLVRMYAPVALQALVDLPSGFRVSAPIAAVVR